MGGSTRSYFEIKSEPFGKTLLDPQSVLQPALFLAGAIHKNVFLCLSMKVSQNQTKSRTIPNPIPNPSPIRGLRSADGWNSVWFYRRSSEFPAGSSVPESMTLGRGFGHSWQDFVTHPPSKNTSLDSFVFPLWNKRTKVCPSGAEFWKVQWPVTSLFLGEVTSRPGTSVLSMPATCMFWQRSHGLPSCSHCLNRAKVGNFIWNLLKWLVNQPYQIYRESLGINEYGW